MPDPPPAERPHFELFDALRGIAVVSVIAFHVASITDKLGRGLSGRTAEVLGAQAVIVFFVISGFLLYRPFVAARVAGRREPSLKRFGRRRAGRILPAYWVALTLLALYPGITGVFSDDGWRYYAFLQLYSTDTINQGIPVAWTLCVEVTFYLTLPLWVIAARRLSPRGDLLALAAIGVAGALLQLLAARQVIPRLWADALSGQLAWLTLGMGLAVWSVVREAGPPGVVVRRPELCWAVALLGLAGLVALTPDGGLAGLVTALSQPEDVPRAVAKIVCSVALAAGFVLPAVFGERAGGLPRRVLAWAPVAFLGTVSYSLYLYHLTIAQLLGFQTDPFHFEATGLGLADDVNTPVLLVLTLALAGAIAAVSFRWVERPFFKPR